MTRSLLAYPLNRGADADIGGAADLQTDVMRFMAILSLCLVAIFALVQSMPMAPPAKPVPPLVPDAVSEPAIEKAQIAAPAPIPESPPEPKVEVISEKSAEAVVLTRPKWKPEPATKATPIAAAEPIATPVREPEGFILRFESDAALMRLVAASQVGVYAIGDERAQRMKVSESRISFWDASIPNSFHEMEVSTVPLPVVGALARTGADTDRINWGVTLPGKLKGQLDELMQNHRGGSLVIETNGSIRLEAL
jgi:hypothetical protein